VADIKNGNADDTDTDSADSHKFFLIESEFINENPHHLRSNENELSQKLGQLKMLSERMNP
jgi:hypothetical protein